MFNWDNSKSETEKYKKNKNMLARNSALNNLPMTLEDLFSNIVEKLRAFHKIALSTACKFSNEAHNPVPLNKAVHITFSAPERYVILIDAPFLQP